VAKLTSKGQLTLPKEVRDKLGLKTGDRLDVTVEDRKVVLRQPAVAFEETLAKFRALAPPHPKGRKPMSIEEMKELVIQRAVAEDERTKSDRYRHQHSPKTRSKG
jgi:AbrB family looped-hinge helix DNA binding protein